MVNNDSPLSIWRWPIRSNLNGVIETNFYVQHRPIILHLHVKSDQALACILNPYSHWYPTTYSLLQMFFFGCITARIVLEETSDEEVTGVPVVRIAWTVRFHT